MKKPKILIKGGCDVDAICFYLRLKNVIKEGSKQGSHGEAIYYTGHSEILLSGCVPSLRSASPLADVASFESCLFSSEVGSFTTIVLSTISEGGCGIYLDEDGKTVVYGGCDEDATKTHRRDYADVSLEDYSHFFQTAHFLGRNPISRTIQNYSRVFKSIPSNVRIVLILGPVEHGEIAEMSPVFRGSDTYFRELNNSLKLAFSTDPRISFLDPNPLIKKRSIYKVTDE